MPKRIRVSEEAFDALDELYKNIRGTKQEIASEAIINYRNRVMRNNSNEEDKDEV